MPLWAPSLAFRLIFSFSLITTLTMLVIGLVSENALEGHFEDEDRSELNIIANKVEEILLTKRAGEDIVWRERRLKDVLVGHHHAALYISDSDERVAFASTDGPDLSLVHDRDGMAPTDIHVDGHRYRILSTKITNPGMPKRLDYRMTVAVSFEYHELFLEKFRHTLWILLFLGIVFIALMALLVVWRGLAPLHRISDRIRHLSVNHLQAQIAPGQVPSELIGLVNSFNDMTTRLDDAFKRISNFSADIAHELRTPVTNMMTQTQVALSRARSIEAYREVLYSNMEEFERMSRMISDMLFLAQSDTGLQPAEPVPVDLAAEVGSLFEFYDAWAEEYGVDLVLKGSAVVMGAPLMLRRALSNLISNAIRHTPRGGQVEVSVDAAAKGLCSVAISNTGTSIPADRLSRIFDRFYHVRSTHHDRDAGTGLGLAIVKSIVEAHKGRIDVTSEGGVTTFSLFLPK